LVFSWYILDSLPYWSSCSPVFALQDGAALWQPGSARAGHHLLLFIAARAASLREHPLQGIPQHSPAHPGAVPSRLPSDFRRISSLRLGWEGEQEAQPQEPQGLWERKVKDEGLSEWLARGTEHFQNNIEQHFTIKSVSMLATFTCYPLVIQLASATEVCGLQFSGLSLRESWHKVYFDFEFELFSAFEWSLRYLCL